MQMGGVENTADLYPPTDVLSLHELLLAVHRATYDSMKKDCLIYYLLKWHGDGRELTYAEKHCISPHYAAIANAYCALVLGMLTFVGKDRLARLVLQGA